MGCVWSICEVRESTASRSNWTSKGDGGRSRLWAVEGAKDSLKSFAVRLGESNVPARGMFSDPSMDVLTNRKVDLRLVAGRRWDWAVTDGQAQTDCHKQVGDEDVGSRLSSNTEVCIRKPVSH